MSALRLRVCVLLVSLNLWPSTFVRAAEPAVIVEQTAAGQAAVVRRSFTTTNVAVREEVDPQDPIERFLLLAPGAPLIVEVSMSIDGQPFRIPREKLIEEMLAAADRDKDGIATWDEALKTPRFHFGRIQGLTLVQLDQTRNSSDTNGNGLVDRAEARRFVAMLFQGADFALAPGVANALVQFGDGRVTNAPPPADVTKLLDTDGDGVLSADEIAAAPQRLKSRDADDNDLLFPNEVNDAAPAQRAAIRQVRDQQLLQNQNAILLGPTATAESITTILKQKQRNDSDGILQRFAALPKLFDQIDENHNGTIEVHEVLKLNTVTPHIGLSVNLGKRGDAAPITLTSLAEEIGTVETKSSDTVVITRPGLQVRFGINATPPYTFNFEAQANQILQQYDADKNGYLEAKELPGNLATQMELWDSDGDGKVFAKEIAEAYARSQAPQMSQVRASVEMLSNALFQALDQTSDGRLSLREMLTAVERLKAFDKDGDGRITVDEIPLTLAVTFSQGNMGFSGRLVAVGAGGINRPAPLPARGPAWFTRMDRNGDGDVTLREFLGDEKQFRALDTNGDGFIELNEAEAAK